MPALAEIGAEQYDTTPEKVVVELFAQGEFCLNHRTLDVEVNALPDREHLVARIDPGGAEGPGGVGERPLP